MCTSCTFTGNGLTGVQINSDNNAACRSVLEQGDDPYGWTAGIENRWRVTSKMQCGQVITDQMGDTKIEYCNPAQIQVGDFVDVCVSFDIVTRKKPGHGRSVQVHLTIQHVIILKSNDTSIEVSSCNAMVYALLMSERVLTWRNRIGKKWKL